jgi:hypothetical protein
MNVLFVYTNDWDPTDLQVSYGHYRFSAGASDEEIFELGDRVCPVNFTCTHVITFARDWKPL